MRRLTFGIGALAVALTLTIGVHSGSARPAPAVPVYSVGMGAVLPNDGARAQVGVSCPEHAPRACAGSIALAPRGGTATALGSGAIARATFRLPPGRDIDLRLRLSAGARAALKRGPISVTTVLRASAASARTARRRVTIARETL